MITGLKYNKTTSLVDAFSIYSNEVISPGGKYDIPIVNSLKEVYLWLNETEIILNTANLYGHASGSGVASKTHPIQ